MFDRTIFRRGRNALALAALLCLAGPLVDRAAACPMCQIANEATGDARPRAYMYSILFMLSMPATILAGFGIGFYRLSRRAPDAAGFSDAAADEGEGPAPHHVC